MLSESESPSSLSFHFLSSVSHSSVPADIAPFAFDVPSPDDIVINARNKTKEKKGLYQAWLVCSAACDGTEVQTALV
jgi:hypothetical protein